MVDSPENVDDDISGVWGDKAVLLLYDMLDGKEVQDQSCGKIFEVVVDYNKGSFTFLLNLYELPEYFSLCPWRNLDYKAKSHLLLSCLTSQELLSHVLHLQRAVTPLSLFHLVVFPLPCIFEIS